MNENLFADKCTRGNALAESGFEDFKDFEDFEGKVVRSYSLTGVFK